MYPCAPPSPSIPIGFLSWNILATEFTNFNTRDKKLESVSTRDKRWNGTVSSLLQISPDIACLQEASTDFVAHLARASVGASDVKVRDQFHLAHALRSADKPDGSVIMTSSNRFQPISITSISLGTPGGTSPRASLVGVYRDLRAHPGEQQVQELCIVSVHLEGHPNLLQVRRQQLIETLQHPLVSQNDHLLRATMLAGDFNEDRGLDELERTLSGLGLKRLRTPSPTFFSTHEGARVLDHMFVSDHLQPLLPATVVLPPDPHSDRLARAPYADFWPSDHFAIYQVLNYSRGL
jgi:endonuclease/exonuclease/phosphatase family metal-dependent hydrolase